MFLESSRQILHDPRLQGLLSVHVLGSFIFGLPTDRQDTFAATAALAKVADLTFAQFVMMPPFPGTVDFHEMRRIPCGICRSKIVREFVSDSVMFRRRSAESEADPPA